jgi:hypothetical protein
VRYTFTILDQHYQQLRRALFRDTKEYGTLLLCGRSRQVDPWTGVIEERALVREVIEVPEETFLERTPTSMTCSTTPLFRLSKRAMVKDNAICIAHSHPRGGLLFLVSTILQTRNHSSSFSAVWRRSGPISPSSWTTMANL